jgi:phosphoribosylformylglycinamidine (FGAM) synthase-like enzyme
VALADERLLSSAHDVSDGGLAVTLAESSLGTAGLAAHADWQGSEPAEAALFGERGARAVVSVAGERLARVSALAAQYGVKVQTVGRVVRGDFQIHYNGRAVMQAPLAKLEYLYEHALEQALADPLPAAG